MNLMTSLLLTALAAGSWIAVPGEAWKPAEQTFEGIQSGLKQFVQKSAADQNKKLNEWSKYSFQFQGQEKDGRKFIYINAYCIDPPEYVEKRFVLVLDGGPCFFNVKYDPESHIFFELQFHGEA